MDIKNYLEKKAKGNAEIITAGGGFAVAIKKFNVDNGEPLTPEITSVDPVALEEEKKELLDKIDDINCVISDINALKSNS